MQPGFPTFLPPEGFRALLARFWWQFSQMHPNLHPKCKQTWQAPEHPGGAPPHLHLPWAAAGPVCCMLASNSPAPVPLAPAATRQPRRGDRRPCTPRISLPALSQLAMLRQTLRSSSCLHTAPAAPLPSPYPSPRRIHRLPESIPSLNPSQPPAKAPSAASAEPCMPLPQRRLPALPCPLRRYFSCLSCQLCSPNVSTHRHCWHPLRLPWDVPVPCKASYSLLLHAAGWESCTVGWGWMGSLRCPEGDGLWHLRHAGSIPAGELLSHPQTSQSTSGKPCLLPGVSSARILCPVSLQPREELRAVPAPGVWQPLHSFPSRLFWDASPPANAALCAGLAV